VTDKHLHALELLGQENKLQQYFLVSRDHISRKRGKIHIMHYEQFLRLLWSDQIKFSDNK
jgi:hypothetical protein